MGNNIPWHIIMKYFRKQATPEELLLMNKWLGEDENNTTILTELFNVYTVTGTLPNQLTPDKRKAWQNINRKISGPSGVIKRLSGRYKYTAASIAVLIIGFFSLWWMNHSRYHQILQQYTEIITPLGQKTMVVLPDSSLVWLNSGSSLKYQGNFNHRKREVLLEGEAFFKVKKDPSKKFRVRSGLLHVDVYGTAFNIKNYENDAIEEITVTEGKVGVSYNLKEIGQLVPKEQALLDKKSNKTIFKNTDPEIISAWKNNELIFNNTPLEEVIKYLERWYGVHITIDTAMKGKHNYTFKIKTESFREMLDMMKMITPLTYEINGKNIIIRYANEN